MGRIGPHSVHTYLILEGHMGTLSMPKQEFHATVVLRHSRALVNGVPIMSANSLRCEWRRSCLPFKTYLLCSIRGSFVLLSIRLKYLQESTVVLVQNYCRTWLASKRSRRRTRLYFTATLFYPGKRNENSRADKTSVHFHSIA